MTGLDVTVGFDDVVERVDRANHGFECAFLDEGGHLAEPVGAELEVAVVDGDPCSVWFEGVLAGFLES